MSALTAAKPLGSDAKPDGPAAVVQTNPMKAAGTNFMDRVMSDAPIIRGTAEATGEAAEVANSTISYALFMEPSDLTKNPVGGGCLAFCMSRMGAFDWNRLKLMRDTIFPQLDGPVAILQLSSMASDNSFIALNTADKNQPLPRVQAKVAGVIRRNLLYKKLPKEDLYVPAGDWADETERSEIAEVLRALQLVGAVAVDYEHVGSRKQPGAAAQPTSSPAASLLAFFARFLGRNSGGGGSSSAFGAKHNNALDSPLSGRVVFRLNARPYMHGRPLDLEEALAPLTSVGDYFHLKRQPAIMTRLRLRMQRGIMINDYFTLIHYTPDSCFLKGMNELQYNSVPKDCGKETIDCGYTMIPRTRNETRFKIIYPDGKDAADGRLAGMDLEREEKQLLPAGSVHPLSSVASWDDIGRSQGPLKSKKKGDSAEEEEEDEEVEKKKAKKDEGDNAAVKAVKTDLVATRRKLYEASTDAYLNKSMLEFALSVKGLPAPPASEGFSCFGGKNASGGKDGMVGKLTGLLVQLNPLANKGGKASAAAAEEDTDDDGAAVPEPIDASRPSMGIIGKHVKASGTWIKP